jgi:hypothetical protein
MITALTNLRASILTYIGMSCALFLCHVYDLINIETNVIPDIETNIPTKGYLNKKRLIFYCKKLVLKISKKLAKLVEFTLEKTEISQLFAKKSTKYVQKINHLIPTTIYCKAN